MPSPDQRLCDQSRQHRIEIKALAEAGSDPTNALRWLSHPLTVTTPLS